MCKPLVTVKNKNARLDIARKTADRSSKMNCECTKLYCAKATQEFPKAQKRNLFQWPIQSTDLTGTEHAFTEVTEDNSDGRKTHSQAASEGNCSLEEHLKGGNSI